MKILCVNDKGKISGWFNYKFAGWGEFINIFTRTTLPENNAYILKAKQDSEFRTMFFNAPRTKKSEFYAVEWNVAGPTVYQIGESVRVGDKDYLATDDFIKSHKWT